MLVGFWLSSEICFRSRQQAARNTRAADRAWPDGSPLSCDDLWDAERAALRPFLVRHMKQIFHIQIGNLSRNPLRDLAQFRDLNHTSTFPCPAHETNLSHTIRKVFSKQKARSPSAPPPHRLSAQFQSSDWRSKW